MHAFLAFFFVFNAFSDQKEIISYRDSKSIFWGHLYSKRTLNTSLYCNKSFTSKSGLNIEHVFAAYWMKNSIPECKRRNRKECRHISDRFNRMEADLHNLYPSVTSVNSARSSTIFGEVNGHHFKRDCPIEIEDYAVEPPDYAKGKVARAVLYMTYEYGVDLDKVTNSPGFEKQILNWHCKFSATADEIKRNNEIFKIQKTLNLFVIDDGFCS